ncbi:unnamed protein product [Paramecium octaurelia]|uniref:Uncharacterized protein n=1 Tax=Paramecium octaurelia TaxID=43137 RepID=A0A8S1UQT9_PAROT|nr:unnamed protein product [Paramecium octaurelia]
MNLLLTSQHITKNNQDRVQNIFSYLGEDQRIILSDLKGAYLSYIIFNPLYCFNLKLFINTFTTNQSNTQQDNNYYIIIRLISLIIKEYKKLQVQKLYHNNIALEHILIFKLDFTSFTNLNFNQVQIKFYKFQDDSPQKSEDLQQIFSLIQQISDRNQKVQNAFKQKKLLEKKNLKDLEQFLDEQTEILQSNKEKQQLLINPLQLEFIEKVSQTFEEKLKEIDKTNFVEAWIWLYYYCYSQEFEKKEIQLIQIIRRLNMNIAIYHEAYSQLCSDMNYETSQLNSFYESQFRGNAGNKLKIERIQNQIERKMKIDFQCEFISFTKTNLYQLEKQQIRKLTEDIINKIWMYFQKKIQNEIFVVMQNEIIKIIEKYAEI